MQGGHLNRHWDPGLYLTYSDLRQRPALELMQRVPLDAPCTVYDIGCGPGYVTRSLHEKWPCANICGVDSSLAMLDTAHALDPAIQWQEADIKEWEPRQRADLIFASAVLHFLDDHDALLPRLISYLTPGGCLALHMPNWWDAPWYQLMSEVLATSGPNGTALGTSELRAELAKNRVGSAEFYYSLLAPRVAHLDVWQTDYLQVMEGDDPVYNWIKVSGLRAVTDNLADADRHAFLEHYVPRLRQTYPCRADGRTLFPFKRIFIVAQKH